jgi:ABC-type uncharacterized transport system permease subunit
MALSFVFGLAALVALVPAAVYPFKKRDDGRVVHWVLLVLAVAGPSFWSFNQFSGQWRADFSVALWLSVSASLLCFLVVCLINEKASALAPLLLPYLLFLGIAASLFQSQEKDVARAVAPSVWVIIHIICSVATYALVTLAAVAGLSVFITERALKRKASNRLTEVLPSIMDAEKLQVGLLVASIVVLLVGLLSGVVLELRETGRILAADHKTILSIGAFLAIAGILYAHVRSGMRGRAAARAVLLAYLLLTLAYLGVKFVSEVLLGAKAL